MLLSTSSQTNPVNENSELIAIKTRDEGGRGMRVTGTTRTLELSLSFQGLWISAFFFLLRMEGLNQVTLVRDLHERNVGLSTETDRLGALGLGVGRLISYLFFPSKQDEKRN